MFYQSLISDWNHGNAHFLRGVVSELLARGHEVDVYEPRDSWSVTNLIAQHGEAAIEQFEMAYPQLKSNRYEADELDLDRILENADLVLVHEWNENSLIDRIGAHRQSHSSYRLLFHDTHHRIAHLDQLPFDLTNYDGVLAYGQVIADMYTHKGWTSSIWVWHEAADTRVFHPMPDIARNHDLVWVGNWGDDERTAELEEFLIKPAVDLQLSTTLYGVRYPEESKRRLDSVGIQYRGWLPNFRVPQIFARHRVTLHIPRQPYVQSLPGIPTIRPFEALACGIPLICSPWLDSEHLFTSGKDYLIARNGSEMKQLLKQVINDQLLAQQLALNGLTAILERHTCAHRVDELLAIYSSLKPAEERSVANAWAVN